MRMCGQHKHMPDSYGMDGVRRRTPKCLHRVFTLVTSNNKPILVGGTSTVSMGQGQRIPECVSATLHSLRFHSLLPAKASQAREPHGELLARRP